MHISIQVDGQFNFNKNHPIFGKPCDDASKFQNEQDISNTAKKEWKYFVQYLRHQIESQNEQ